MNPTYDLHTRIDATSQVVYWHITDMFGDKIASGSDTRANVLWLLAGLMTGEIDPKTLGLCHTTIQ